MFTMNYCISETLRAVGTPNTAPTVLLPQFSSIKRVSSSRRVSSMPGLYSFTSYQLPIIVVVAAAVVVVGGGGGGVVVVIISMKFHF